MIGKDVRIIAVKEHQTVPDKPDFSALGSIAGRIDLDFQAIEALRTRST